MQERSQEVGQRHCSGSTVEGEETRISVYPKAAAGGPESTHQIPPTEQTIAANTGLNVGQHTAEATAGSTSDSADQNDAEFDDAVHGPDQVLNYAFCDSDRLDPVVNHIDAIGENSEKANATNFEDDETDSVEQSSYPEGGNAGPEFGHHCFRFGFPQSDC